MIVRCTIGNDLVMIDAWVNLASEEVFYIEYKGIDIKEVLELSTLNRITEAAQQKFIEDMNEP